MRSILISISLVAVVALHAQRGSTPPDFYFQSQPNENVGLNKFLHLDRVRRADFIPAPYDAKPSVKTVDRSDPGSTGHLTLVQKDKISLNGYTDSAQALLESYGSLIYTFESNDLLDSSGFLVLIHDSTTASNFLSKIPKIKKREWELYRITIRKKGSTEKTHIFIRYLMSIFTVHLPDKSNRETIKINSISPAIPVIHLGEIDYDRYQPGPGISFNIGLIPRRPFPRLIADIVGPISIELMFTPVTSLNDILAVRSSAVGFFFNSFYGILHWGIAWYTPTFARAEAYIGINLAPAMQLLEGGKKNRYRW